MIRSVAPIDLWILRRKPHNQVILYNEKLLVRWHHPFWFASRCLLQGTGRERDMVVYRNRSVCATAQAHGPSDRPELSIIYLSTQKAGCGWNHTENDIWYRLLERLCVNAGHNHIQRIYTVAWSHQHEVREIFRQLGFQTYAQQVVLQLSGPDWDQGTTRSPMRAQSRQDAWAIHKLYGAVTPRLVQQAEVRSPRTWVLPLSHHWQRCRRRAWVVGPQDDLRAYLHILSGPDAHAITLLLHPDERDQAADIVRFGLAQILDTRPVYLLLREYHQELLGPLQNLGFQVAGEQALLVKNTVIPVRRAVTLSTFKARIWDTQVTIPRISIPEEDSQPYVTRARHDE
jgi:hypothetical protein